MYSPKIQRLVTPLRLQRRRHLRSLKRRRIERQKEQKSEYEYVAAFHRYMRYIYSLSALCLPSVWPRGRRRSPLSRRHTRSMSFVRVERSSPTLTLVFSLQGNYRLKCLLVDLVLCGLSLYGYCTHALLTTKPRNAMHVLWVPLSCDSRFDHKAVRGGDGLCHYKISLSMATPLFVVGERSQLRNSSCLSQPY